MSFPSLLRFLSSLSVRNDRPVSEKLDQICDRKESIEVVSDNDEQNVERRDNDKQLETFDNCCRRTSED